MTPRWVRAALVVAFLAGGAAGCTGVPGSSHPDTVQHLGGTQPSQLVAPPPLNADPRSLVQAFLSANAVDAANGGSAGQYLTPAARRTWSDTTITVLNDYQVTSPVGNTVTVTGNQVATIDADGIYTPDLNGSGGGGESVSFTFTLRKVNGQYRIDRLRNGLVLSFDAFQTYFTQRTLYFYDANEHYLVPDVRYSALGDAQLLARWLVDQLIKGPQKGLQNAELNVEWPPQATEGRVIPKVGGVTTVEVPGSGRWPTGNLNRLAAQLASTLDQAEPSGLFTITDSGKPVTIPAIGGAQFSAAEFSSTLGPQSQLADATVYYLHAGGIVDGRGRPLTGDLGSGHYALTSVALARLATSPNLYVAGTTAAPGNESRLLVGSDIAGLKQTAVVGALTRPTWVPGMDEVWIGSAAQLYRVSSAGHVAKVAVAGLPPGGQIEAVRMSPDGSRVALVIAGKSGPTSQVYVGTVDRGSGQVSVDALTPISPVGVHIDDVAWNDTRKLFLVGSLPSGDARIIEVRVDGSLWTASSAPQLPGVPDTITVAENQPAWVSVGGVDGSVWEQSGGSWISPNDPGQTVGTSPVYLE